MKVHNLTATGKSWFCSNWPLVKTVLQFMQVNAKNWIVRLATTVIITAGDTAKEKICPAPAAAE